MSRAKWIGTACLTASLAAAMATPALAGKPERPADLSGQWLLDRSRSETPRPGRGPWGARRGGRGGFAGEPGPSDPAPGAGRRARLPDRIVIREPAGHVLLGDSTGTTLLDILTAGGESGDAGGTSVAALELRGKWKEDRLVVERTGPRGGTITESYRIEDKGRTLVIETKIESDGRRPAIRFKRVYDRVGS